MYIVTVTIGQINHGGGTGTYSITKPTWRGSFLGPTDFDSYTIFLVLGHLIWKSLSTPPCLLFEVQLAATLVLASLKFFFALFRIIF